jgi:hypothetical protein
MKAQVVSFWKAYRTMPYKMAVSGSLRSAPGGIMPAYNPDLPQAISAK